MHGISYGILYVISHKICKTKTIWLVCRTVFASLLHFHSTCKLQKILIHLQTLTSQARESFGMRSQSFFLLAPCVTLAIKRILRLIHKCNWYSSVRLSQSPCLQTMSCRQRRRCQCCIRIQRETCLHVRVPCGKRAWTGAPDSLLHIWQYSSNHSILFQGGKSGGSKG